jgi:hypothetical protein
MLRAYRSTLWKLAPPVVEIGSTPVKPLRLNAKIRGWYPQGELNPCFHRERVMS